MTRNELIKSLTVTLDCDKKKACAVLDATLATIQETLASGEKVAVTGFGTFEIRERGEKTCINPKTKEKMICPPCKAPVFKAGSALKTAVNK